MSDAERFVPWMADPYIAYEHWHRYLFAARYAAGKTVLDVACGEGYGSNLLARAAASVVGVDVDPDVVRAAAEAYPAPNLSFRCGPAERLPVEGEHLFDLVVSFETLEHLTAEAQAGFAAEARRVLKPGGALLISTPNPQVYTERNRHANPFHLRELTRDEFLALLGRHFAHVQLLAQRVYPASYIWHTGQPARHYSEHQLRLDCGQFRPADGDAKEQLYFVAICSDSPLPEVENSLLVDVDEVATRGLPARERVHDAILYADTGAGFSPEVACSARVHEGEFIARYDLRAFGPVRALRWDPVEQRPCRVRLTAVEWRDASGASRELDVADLMTNGEPLGGGDFRFDTSDPAVVLPVSGAGSELTIRGHFVPEDAVAALGRTEARVREAQAELDALKSDVARREAAYTTLYADTGEGFRADLAWSLPTVSGDGEFAFTFRFPDLEVRDPVRSLRWDPVENRLCRVQLDEVSWDDEGGNHSLDLGSVKSNGRAAGPGAFEFETHDPMLFLSVSGRVASVTVRGRWEVLSPSESLASLAARVGECREQSAAQAVRLRAQEDRIAAQGEAIRALEERVRLYEGLVRAQAAALGARDARIAALESELAAASEQGANLDRHLQSVLGSKKWRLAVALVDAAYYLPRRCRAAARRLRAAR